MMKFRCDEKGRSMVEMMGYMAVVMTVVVAVGKMVTNIFDEHRLSQASLQVGDLAAAVSKAGAMEKDYKDVITDVQTYHKYIPDSYRVAGNKIFHILGGETTVGAYDEGSRFYITFAGLRRKQCIELGLKAWQRNQNVDLYAISVNGTTSYWPVYRSGLTESSSLPMTRAKLSGTGENDMGLCNNDTGNTITWIFN